MLLIEGIFALHYPGVRALCDLRIYVDTPDEVCYARRMARDVRDRRALGGFSGSVLRYERPPHG